MHYWNNYDRVSIIIIREGKRVERKITATLLIVVVAFSALIGSVQLVNMFTNWRVAPVTTSAMEPAVPQGALIVSKLTPEKDIKRGDIVTIGVGTQNDNLIGRVLDITTDDKQYYNIALKSDQNPLPDNFPYKTRDVTYKEQFDIPFLGFAVVALTSPVGWIITTLLLLGLGLVYLYRFHAPVSQDLRVVHSTERARKKAVQRIAERGDHNGVEKINALFVESEVSN